MPKAVRVNSKGPSPQAHLERERGMGEDRREGERRRERERGMGEDRREGERGRGRERGMREDRREGERERERDGGMEGGRAFMLTRCLTEIEEEEGQAGIRRDVHQTETERHHGYETMLLC